MPAGLAQSSHRRSRSISSNHHVVELALRGSTPGKRMAGVRIVARDGGAPSVGALLTRNVFRLVDSLPLFYGVGLITVVLTREHLRIGGHGSRHAAGVRAGGCTPADACC